AGGVHRRRCRLDRNLGRRSSGRALLAVRAPSVLLPCRAAMPAPGSNHDRTLWPRCPRRVRTPISWGVNGRQRVHLRAIDNVAGPGSCQGSGRTLWLLISRVNTPREAPRPGGERASRMALTICSDSACFTRGSFLPWAISIGILMRSALNSGERDLRNSSSFSRSPTRTAKIFFIGSQYGGIHLSSLTRVEGAPPLMAHADTPRLKVAPASAAGPPHD